MDVSNFNSKKGTRYGVALECRTCARRRKNRWASEHTEHIKRYNREKNSTEENKAKNRASSSNHRSRFFGVVNRLSRELASRLMRERQSICPYCGGKLERPEIDHIIPISGGGTNSEDNLIVVCMKCNRQKSSKPLAQFLYENGIKRMK